MFGLKHNMSGFGFDTHNLAIIFGYQGKRVIMPDRAALLTKVACSD